MRWIFRCVLVALCLGAAADAQVSAPRVGVARYADGSLRTVFGLHNDFVVSSATLGGAAAVSFSDFGGMIFSRGRIELLDRDGKLVAQYDSSETKPVLNIDGDLMSAIAWLPHEQALVRWNGTSLVATPVQSGALGEVSSVRTLSSNTARLLFSESGGVVAAATVSLDTGDLLSLNLLAGVTAPVFEQHVFLVFHDARGLEIAAPNGTLRTLPVDASDLRFERMSSDWVHVWSAAAGRNWILHLNDRSLEFGELPGPRVHASLPAITANRGGGK